MKNINAHDDYKYEGVDTYLYDVQIWNCSELVKELEHVEATSTGEAIVNVQNDLLELLSNPELKDWSGVLADYDIKVVHNSNAGDYELIADDIADVIMEAVEELLEDDGILDGQSAVVMRRISEWCSTKSKVFDDRSKHPLEIQYRTKRKLIY